MQEHQENQEAQAPGIRDNVPVPPFQIPMPYVTKQRFSELSGLDIGVVDAHVDRGYLPSKRIGRHRLINLARLWAEALQGMEG